MAKILSFAAAGKTKGFRASSSQPPRVNPAQLWIDQRRPGASQVTASAYANTLARLLGYADYHACPWHALDYGDVMEARRALLALVEADVYTPDSCNQLLAAVKNIMAEVWRLGIANGARYLDADALKLIQDAPPIPGRQKRRERRILTEAEAASLLSHCAADLSPRGMRDAALIAVALACGLRASEYAALTVADYDRAEENTRKGARLRIPQIKVDISDQDVWLPFGPPASDYLDRWLARRGYAPGVIFTRMERGGLGVIQEVLPDAITEIVKTRAASCGLGRVTAHDLRATLITRILAYTGDLSAAAKIARHSSTATTARYYDKRSMADMRETMARVPWPVLGDGDSPQG